MLQKRTPNIAHVRLPEDAFFLYINKNLIDITIRYTNIEGKRHKNDFRKTLDVIELKCFIGCLLHTYTLHQNMHSLATFFILSKVAHWYGYH